MIYMLFDNPADKKKMAFLSKYETASIRQVYPSKKCNSIKEILLECKSILDQSTNGDTIICWYDFMAVLCWWLCKIFRKKRKIVAVNILLKNKDTVKNRLARFLYRPVLNSNNVRATVTSKKYGEYLNKMLGIRGKYTLLHDIYYSGYDISYHGEILHNSVFCGGHNGRNWEMLIKIARIMPEVTFNCVMPRDKFDQYKSCITPNMNVKTEIPEKEFLEFMCKSQLIVMPLDTEAPAGLIAFYQAAANGKMSVTSDSVTTQEYFSNDRGALCGDNPSDWRKTVLYYLQNTNKADSCVNEFRNFLDKECSEKKFAETLWQIVANNED